MTPKELRKAVSAWLKSSFRGAVLPLATAALAATTASDAAPSGPLDHGAKVQYLQKHLAKPGSLKGRFLVKPPGADLQAAARMLSMQAEGLTPSGPGTTVPYWSTKITSPLDGMTYHVSMVGSSPYAATPKNTNVKYVPIIVRIHLDGFVFDPTKNGNCDSMPVSTRYYNSPLFKPASFTSNGVNVTPTKKQLVSAFQRANFWNKVKGTDYGVTLTSGGATPIVTDFWASVPEDEVVGVSTPCGIVPIALLSIDEYDTLMQTLAFTYAASNQVPLVLSYNILMYINDPSNCCVLGYHNAVQFSTGTQLYAVGAYLDPGIISGAQDISVWSHEIGELIDDPFVQAVTGIPGGYQNDLTPAWGHIGQVSGCQNNLEDGDPLSGTLYSVTGSGGFAYHYQDLAFHDWFYRTKSTSAGGSGSFKGNLPSGGQGACF
jgi:hypothetical protein